MAGHAGAAAGAGSLPVPAERLTDPDWIAGRVELAASLYGRASDAVLATVSWYSASSVLLAPAIESLVLHGSALDPSLDAVTLHVRPDGRFTGARSARMCPTAGLEGLGARFADAIGAVVERFSATSGARSRALWAIAADSIANRLLWAGQAAGDVHRATALAAPLAEAIGTDLPRPRYTEIGPHRVVRRVSCCLIDRATGGEKCVSCPNQHPDVRDRRIRRALGS
ncbi:(2Fe-2S)-binding protein [Haloechinothrix alba]|nr:(2Fe-2S)-binding protein [Haloechinothrix alba]